MDTTATQTNASVRGNGEMENLTVANTILAQLGGRRFQVMTGARDFVGFDAQDAGVRGGLMFAIGRNPGKISKVVIRLNAADLYDVSLYAGRGVGMIESERHTDIYADKLADVFERATGLATSLGTMGAAAPAVAS